MNDIICINNTFKPEIEEFYQKFGVVKPSLDKIYQIRQVRHDVGKTGFLLEGLNNPNVPIDIGYKVIQIEPSWNIDRFRTLMNEPLKLEEFNENILIKN